jgi:hypothetical protein
MLGSFSGIGSPLVLLSLCVMLALLAHVVWAVQSGRMIWRSARSTPVRLALITIVGVTPIVGFYAAILLQSLAFPRSSRRQLQRLWWGNLLAAPLAVTLCAQLSNLRYTPEDRGWSVFLGFIPGALAYYVVVQLVVYMAAQVFGLSQRGPISTRTHLLSACLIVSTAL